MKTVAIQEMSGTALTLLSLGVLLILSVASCERSNSPVSPPPRPPAIEPKPIAPADPEGAEENVVEPPEVETIERPVPHEDDPPEVVEVSPQPEPEPPVNGLTENQQYARDVLGPGSKVIVQNTPEDHGLHMRDPAGLHLGEANIIGHMFNGATGTILDGPEIVSDLYWFEIKWNDIGGLGRCEINNREPYVGWSAAVSEKDTRLLQLVED